MIEGIRIEELLKDFALSEKEAKVYLGSLRLGNALVKDIAKEASLNRTTTYNLLLGLRKVGLVSSYQKNNLTYFSPSSPSVLGNLADKKIDEQQRLKQKINSFLPVLNAMFQSRTRGSTVKMFEGLGSLPEIYYSVYGNAKYPTEGFEFTNWGGKYELFPQSPRKEIVEFFLKNKIRTRSLLVEDDLTKGWFEKGHGKWENKTIHLVQNPGWNFFCNLEMCENRLAIVTYKNDADAQGIVIESTELASMFKFLFDSLWFNKT